MSERGRIVTMRRAAFTEIYSPRAARARTVARLDFNGDDQRSHDDIDPYTRASGSSSSSGRARTCRRARRELVERIFEPFVSTKPEGMGMGLMFCRAVVEAHGGRLWTGPAHPRGAVFTFSIPTALVSTDAQEVTG
ncbi:ATP-binding protein [Rhodoplanes sp. SY1]|uniref:ATP-binding protein n=1 Tax=Rhodoplanes sp. SY1 TaxID=3166646 RepID=UPI0038B69604